MIIFKVAMNSDGISVKLFILNGDKIYASCFQLCIDIGALAGRAPRGTGDEVL